MEVNGDQPLFVTNIFQNIFFPTELAAMRRNLPPNNTYL